ncbi:hypothetical protein LINPERPRIM_LOCUS38566 [Linum perenne]
MLQSMDYCSALPICRNSFVMTVLMALLVKLCTIVEGELEDES